jgi:hypothetical protein
MENGRNKAGKFERKLEQGQGERGKISQRGAKKNKEKERKKGRGKKMKSITLITSKAVCKCHH